MNGKSSSVFTGKKKTSCTLVAQAIQNNSVRAQMSELIQMNNEINVHTLCTGVYDERANDKRAISRFLSETSANASGSIFYLYERMNTRRCKMS